MKTGNDSVLLQKITKTAVWKNSVFYYPFFLSKV